MIDEDRILTLMPERVNGCDRLLWRGRHLNTILLLQVGAAEYLIRIEEGKIAKVGKGPFVMPDWRFALRADEEVWSQFWSSRPPPGFHDLLALSKGKHLRIEGDIYPLMSNLLYFKDILSSIRLSGDKE